MAVAVGAFDGSSIIWGCSNAAGMDYGKEMARQRWRSAVTVAVGNGVCQQHLMAKMDNSNGNKDKDNNCARELVMAFDSGILQQHFTAAMDYNKAMARQRWCLAVVAAGGNGIWRQCLTVTIDNRNRCGNINDNHARALHIKKEEDHHGRIGL